MNTIHDRRAFQDRTLGALFLIGLLLVLASLSSCTVDRTNVTPAQAVTLEQLEQEYAAAEASGDPVAIATAEAKLDEFDKMVIQERGAAILGPLGAVPGVGPLATILAPLILAGLPLASKRGRGHLKNAFTGKAPIVSSVAKAYGMKHSADAPANG